MKVKTFSGATINEALTAVKEEMGDSVLILETRSKPIDGISGMFGKKMVEVIVADDDSNQANSSPFSALGMANDEAKDPESLLEFEEQAKQVEARTSQLPPPVIRRPTELTERAYGKRPEVVDEAELEVFRKELEAMVDEKMPVINVPVRMHLPQEVPALVGAAAGNGAGAGNGLHKIYGIGNPMQGDVPAQLPTVLNQIQKINENGANADIPTLPQPSSAQMQFGYQAPQFAQLSAQNGTIPASPTHSPFPEDAGLPMQKRNGGYELPATPELPITERPKPTDIEESEGKANTQIPRQAAEAPSTPTLQHSNAPSTPVASTKSDTSATPTPSSYPEAFQPVFEHLLDQDMPKPLAKSLIKYVIKQLGADATDEDIQNKLRSTLRSAVRTAPILDRENPKIVEGLSAKDEDEASQSDPWSILDDDPFADDLEAEVSIVDNDSAPDSKPSTIVAFVGTSGVGKTSSLAKIAAHFANKKVRTVGLIGIETPHVGSVDRLEAYGKLMGAQFKKVRSPGQLAEAIKEMSGCAYIFIDTPACSLKKGERKNGRSPFQPKHLQLFFSAAPGVQKHLVLNANTRGRDLNAAAKAFDTLDIDRLLFSKLDETNALGHLFGLLEKTKLPISYLTSSQEIPGDLNEVNAEEMVERMVGNA